MEVFAVVRFDLFAILLAILVFAESKIYRTAEETVRFAAIIHRHVDRTPARSYPNDPHINYKWPGGHGALLPEGSLQMFTLGKTLRNRYAKLLPSDGVYTAERILVMSSAVDRAQMSSQSLLAGFMPPPSERNPLPILWQPIPVHPIPQKLDDLISLSAPCPKYYKIYLEYLRNPPPEIKNIFQENGDLHKYLKEKSGLNNTIERTGLILWDTLIVQHNHNMTLPAWTESVFPDRLFKLVEQGFALRTHTKYMRLVKGGPLVTKIVNQMLQFQSGNSSRSVNVYSGHDLTLSSVMRLLDLSNQTTGVPDYGATLAFELHQTNGRSQLEVRIVYYFNFNAKEPKQLTIPNCPAPCLLDQFVKSIEFITDFDYANACKLDEKN